MLLQVPVEYHGRGWTAARPAAVAPLLTPAGNSPPVTPLASASVLTPSTALGVIPPSAAANVDPLELLPCATPKGTVAGSTVTTVRIVLDATSDNQSDDRGAIQAAIDAASNAGGGVVQLPAGVFRVEAALIMKNGVRLADAGRATIIEAAGSFMLSHGPLGGHPLITTDGANNTTISNLTADQGGDVLNGNADEGRLTEYLIDIRYSHDAVVDGVYTRNPFTYSIGVVASSAFCVQNSNVSAASSGLYDQLDGIHVLDSSYGSVVHNYVDQGIGSDGDDGLVAHTKGDTVHDLTFSDNQVRGGHGGSGLQIAVGTYQISNITSADNTFWGSPNGILTGYYGDSAKVHDIAISGNSIRDDNGPSVELLGRLTNISVTGNNACQSGRFDAQSHPGGC